MNPPALWGLPAMGVWAGLARATSTSNLDQTNAVLWTMIAISAAGAIVTFAILVYALRKFQDPSTRRRRYG